jgi:HEAT repeat protein
VFFRDPDPATARAIDNSVNLFGSPSPSDRERARDALHDVGIWSVPRLLEAVRSMGSQHRCNSLLVLGRLGDPRALATMRATLAEDGSDWPPAFAALMLGRMGDVDDRTMTVYRAALASRENEKRKISIALALGKIHRRRADDAGEMLVRILEAPTPTPAVHEAALLALGFFRARVAVPSEDGSRWVPSPRIEAALSSKREGMRLSAIVALAVSRLDGFEGVFREAFERDGDTRVRLAALLAWGKPRDVPDDAVTDRLTRVLKDMRVTGKERRLAAYLLTLRKDPRSVKALIDTANSPRSAEVAAAAVVALGGIEDERVAPLLVGKLTDRSATVRAAAAVASVELVATEDLKRLRVALRRRLERGETDKAVKFDMTAAMDEIGKILRDRDERRGGIEVKPRPEPQWLEADATDLFHRLGRSHRQAVLDTENLRVLQVLGIATLHPYRPGFDTGVPSGESGSGELGSVNRFRRDHSDTLEKWDLRIEFDRRPYYTLEDYPDRAGDRPAVPREGR